MSSSAPGASSPPRPLEAVRSPVWLMYRAMVGIGLVCGVLIVLAYQWTKPVIEKNRAEALRKAIFFVLPEAKSSVTYKLGEDDRFAVLEGKADGARVVYAGYDEGGQLVGFAIRAQGMGYQDTIVVLYAYVPGRDAITGFRVLETRETPGLGDKIDVDPGFLANFERLTVELTADLSAVVHPIEVVKHGTKSQPWQIDAITGATVSSTAVAKILRESSAFWIPRIRQHLDDFRQGR